jgi:hypothetical protein
LWLTPFCCLEVIGYNVNQGTSFCSADQAYMQYIGFGSTDFHPSQLDSNPLYYYWPPNLTSSSGEVGVSYRAAGYQQLFLDAGSPFNKRRPELGYNCVMTAGSNAGVRFSHYYRALDISIYDFCQLRVKDSLLFQVEVGLVASTKPKWPQAASRILTSPFSYVAQTLNFGR